MAVADFRLAPKKRRKVNVDLLGKVCGQMQGLVDTPPDPENPTEVAMHNLVSTWYDMLMTALVEEAKKQ